ncbi:hypothetical protein M2454_002044 [Aequitasia blattaphilus]|uniref:Uncharacterized protein n=1 Tax=Aequitasia blattaphilus TaxID=2949332 RepID=A0ABT1EA68_9FIRM|nr:hypothetical protein [Aequitasia blattaphilus]MCP1102730.1 hypothetical protein [Aequitasia blattaphilus]MCR8615370.1 hypothetical protein [Aequitasia blattaphilus]
MQEFIDDLGKRVMSVAKDVGEKAEEVIGIQKLKSDIRSLERGNNRDLLHIGKMVYEKFKDGETVDLNYITLCEGIEQREEEIEKKEEEIDSMK